MLKTCEYKLPNAYVSLINNLLLLSKFGDRMIIFKVPKMSCPMIKPVLWLGYNFFSLFWFLLFFFDASHQFGIQLIDQVFKPYGHHHYINIDLTRTHDHSQTIYTCK